MPSYKYDKSYVSLQIMTKVMSAYKNDDLLGKENYGLISLLAHMSKVLEKLQLHFNKINEYLTPYFSGFLTDLWRNHCTKHHLTKIPEI